MGRQGGAEVFSADFWTNATVRVSHCQRGKQHGPSIHEKVYLSLPTSLAPPPSFCSASLSNFPLRTPRRGWKPTLRSVSSSPHLHWEKWTASARIKRPSVNRVASSSQREASESFRVKSPEIHTSFDIFEGSLAHAGQGVSVRREKASEQQQVHWPLTFWTSIHSHVLKPENVLNFWTWL